MNFNFPKSEKLTSEKEISALFGKGKRMTLFPIKVLWQPNERSNHQVLIGCPKRNMKKAVDRNLIKRRMREAYRLHKHLLYEQKENDITYFNIAFIFIGNEIVDSSVIHAKLQKAMEKLIENCQNHE